VTIRHRRTTHKWLLCLVFNDLTSTQNLLLVTCRVQKLVTQQRGKCGVTRQTQVRRRSFRMLAERAALPRRMELPGPTYADRTRRKLASLVQTFGSRRSRASLSDGIASGRPEQRTNLPYSETPHATIEVRAIAPVAIVNQESRWRSIPGATFHDLLYGPLSDAASLQRGALPCSRAG
jgi:hypothetical protein